MTWPAAQPGESRRVDCPRGYIGEMSRECTAEGTWGPISNLCGMG